jgi:dephospho-CoA kinase
MTLVVGLTGGIGSGKSTVARLLGDLGARVVDADVLARRVVAPGAPALAEIAQVFGPDVVEPDGTLARRRLGERVFRDPDARQRLEAITHPRIAAAFADEVSRAQAEDVAVLVYEAALLVESGAYRLMDRVVVVTAPEARQVERVGARDGLPGEAARARIASQSTTADKVAVADHVIVNDGGLAELEARVQAVWEELSHGGSAR